VKPLGFWDGAFTVISAVMWLAGTPAVWLLSLVPLLVFVLLASGAVYLALWVVKPWIATFFVGAVTVLAKVAASAVSWIAGALAGFIGVTLAWLITPALSAPALERIVIKREESLGVQARSAAHFLLQLRCGFYALTAAAFVVGPLMIALWLIDWLVPPLVIVTLPLKFAATLSALGWTLLDYPLTLRGMGVRERWALMQNHPLPVLGFAFAFTVFFWVPFSSLVLLPVGAAAAAELCARLLTVGSVEERR
jgi:hypothetical protein